MEKAEFKALLRKHLRLHIVHEDGKVKINLVYEDSPDNVVIDSDFIDYTEVVRVVERLNAGEVH